MMRFLLSLTVGATVWAGDWSAPVDVFHDTTRCVTYRAKLEGGYLVVRAAHEPGWHSYSLDNQKRVDEKLAGKQALGVDRPTEVRLLSGLQLAGGWQQSEPKEKSQPELNLFGWIFEGETLLAAKVRSTGGLVKVNVHGQVCTEVHCKTVDVTLSPRPGKDSPRPPPELKGLVPAR